MTEEDDGTMATSGATHDLLLPAGARLVHVGPHKTGTSAVQGAFHASRAAVETQGVHYAGPTRQPHRAALAVTGRRWQMGDGGPAPIRDWHALVREIRGAQDARVVVSSEVFAEAEPDAIRRIVGDLDPARVHVAVTLRPLARILASQWQQYVQSGLTRGFDDWLDGILRSEPGTVTPSFWRRHRHDELIERWAEVAGPERVTAIVLDERDRGMVLRTFERLVGLREGTLVPDDERSNRSLTLPEVEAVRAFNVVFKAAGLGTPLHGKVMRLGAAVQMKLREPAAEWPRIQTPQWALDRAAEVAREMVPRIAASGVRVVGDLDSLAAAGSSGLPGDRQPEVRIPPQVAASMAMGVLFASGLARDGGTVRGRPSGGSRAGRWLGLQPWFEPPELQQTPTIVLGYVLAGRSRAAVTGRVRRLLRFRR